jgi:hypothetical protein
MNSHHVIIAIVRKWRCSGAIAACVIASVFNFSGRAKADVPPQPGVPAWTPDRICAALAWREDQLRNCTFSFAEDCRVIQGEPPKKAPISTSVMDVKCKNGTIWIDRTVQFQVAPSLNVEHGLESWDGARFIWCEPHRVSETDTQLQGGIKQGEPPVLADTLFFSVLGIRQTENPLPWSRWIANMLASKGAEVNLTEDDEQGQHCVHLSIAPGDAQPREHFQFTFLPNRDFVAREFDMSIGKSKSWGAHWEVARFAQFDGFWMPVEVNSLHGGQVKNDIVCTLKRFSLKSPSDESMKIDFPNRTRVMDMINMQYYTVLPNGQREYQRFLDSNTGKIIEPSAQSTTRP